MFFSRDTEFRKHQLSLLTSFRTPLASSLSSPCWTKLGSPRNKQLGCWEKKNKQSHKHTYQYTSYILKQEAYIDLSIQRRATLPKPELTSRTAGCLLQSKVGRVDTLRHLQISTSHQKRNLHAPHAAPPLLTGQKILWSSLWTRTGCCWMLGILESSHLDTAPTWEAAHHGKSHRRLICANNLQSFQHSDLESWKPKKTTFFYYSTLYLAKLKMVDAEQMSTSSYRN